MAQRGKARKMVNLDVTETSGVDHPAHQHEGWLVCKSAGADQVGDLFGSFNAKKETQVPKPNVRKNADGSPAEQPAGDNGDNGGTPTTLTVEEVQALTEERDRLQAEKDEAERQAAEDSAAEDAHKADDGDDFEKALSSMPAGVQAIIRKQAKDAEADREAFQKERAQRLDGEAIAKSRDTYKSLGINHDEVAPALRRVAEQDADLAKAVETALSAADGQLAEAGLFKEMGGAGNDEGSSALDRINAAAAEVVKNGEAKTHAEGFNKALTDNPDLYNAYLSEKAGK